MEITSLPLLINYITIDTCQNNDADAAATQNAKICQFYRKIAEVQFEPACFLMDSGTKFAAAHDTN